MERIEGMGCGGASRDMGGWEGMGEELPRELKWEVQLAKKEKRGRPKGGMLMGIRREWMEKGSKIEEGREDIMVNRM